MEIEICKEIQAVVLGFRNALFAIEDDLMNEELSKRMRKLFEDTMEELLPTKAFAYFEDSDDVSIFDDEETRDSFINEAHDEFENSIDKDEGGNFNWRPMSYEEFKNLFGTGGNLDLYTANERTGELIYEIP